MSAPVKTCPFCHAPAAVEAPRCRKCGRPFSRRSVPQEPPDAARPEPTFGQNPRGRRRNLGNAGPPIPLAQVVTSGVPAEAVTGPTSEPSEPAASVDDRIATYFLKAAAIVAVLAATFVTAAVVVQPWRSRRDPELIGVGRTETVTSAVKWQEHTAPANSHSSPAMINPPVEAPVLPPVRNLETTPGPGPIHLAIDPGDTASAPPSPTLNLTDDSDIRAHKPGFRKAIHRAVPTAGSTGGPRSESH
jgi:hypothetical protein